MIWMVERLDISKVKYDPLADGSDDVDLYEWVVPFNSPREDLLNPKDGDLSMSV